MAYSGGEELWLAQAPALSPRLDGGEGLSPRLSVVTAPPAEGTAPVSTLPAGSAAPLRPDSPQPASPPVPSLALPSHLAPPPAKVRTALVGKGFLAQRQVGYSDLIKLPKLEQEDLLVNLEERFMESIVYTYIGDIVVSVNPFTRTGNDTDEVHQAYLHEDPQRAITELPPHIFCLVGQAFQQMRTRGAKSLSILISGESGAGKTEAMKLCVGHLGVIASAVAAASGSGYDTGVSVATKLMKTNPIMEPIGNAKTVRNNNSSRFGKHFDIQFDGQGQILGASTSVYLLEKPRICTHMPGERNYHIFYMLCKAGADVRAPGRIGSWEEYAFLKQEGTIELVTSWHDEEEMVAMHAALGELGFSASQVSHYYMMIFIVLQLGNLAFDSAEVEGADGGLVEGTVVRDTQQLDLVVEMLQVSCEQLLAALTKTVLIIGNDEIPQELPIGKATAALQSLCMYVYSLAFSWCVKKINETIAAPDESVAHCIGVLDIFGFENFNAKGQINSFPQLCINLTNERLHQLFIEHIFEVEQRFYESEDIEWATIDYDDNKAIIEMIARKPGGIFAYVDDECQKKTPTNDEALLQNLHAKFNQKPYKDKVYSKPKQPGRFVIHHFAGEVLYTVAGFIEKNKDELSPTVSTLLEQHTRFDQLKELARAEKRRMEVAVLDRSASKSPPKPLDKSPSKPLDRKPGSRGKRAAGGGVRTRKKTVSESFGESLNLLMDKLGCTDHYYIRCLKPNHALSAGVFDRELMLRQLAYSGTLEVTKVRKAGLNVRWELERFFSQYKMCAKNMRTLRANTLREQCRILLDQIELDGATYRVGRTLVFMASEEVLEVLDALREQRIKEYAYLIYSHWRAKKEFDKFKLKKKHAVHIQHTLRGIRTRKAYVKVRETTKQLQHVTLVKLARLRAAKLKLEPDNFREILQRDEGAVDGIINEGTGETISLTQSVALAQLFPRAANETVRAYHERLKNLSEDQKAQLQAKRQELAAHPELAIAESTDSQLTSMVLSNMLWLRSGVAVRVAGRIVKAVDEPKLPPFRTNMDGRRGWSANVRVVVETIDPPAGGHALDTTDELDGMHVCRAHISKGTLTLDELSDGDQPRRHIGVYPLAYCVCRTNGAAEGTAGAIGDDQGITELIVEQVRTLVYEPVDAAQADATVTDSWLWRMLVGGASAVLRLPSMLALSPSASTDQPAKTARDDVTMPSKPAGATPSKSPGAGGSLLASLSSPLVAARSRFGRGPATEPADDNDDCLSEVSTALSEPQDTEPPPPRRQRLTFVDFAARPESPMPSTAVSFNSPQPRTSPERARGWMLGHMGAARASGGLFRPSVRSGRLSEAEHASPPPSTPTKVRIGMPNTPSLAVLKEQIDEAMEDVAAVDSFVIQPRSKEAELAANASEANPQAPPMADATSTSLLSLAASSGRTTHKNLLHGGGGASKLKDGFLLRRLPGGEWGRRYFVLTADGKLWWYRSRDEVERASVGHDTTVHSSAGQLLLRFFSVQRVSSNTQGAAVENEAFMIEPSAEPCEDPELQKILASCAIFEVRCGTQTLRLAAQSVVAEEWLHSLKSACILNYPKCLVFSDKEVQVGWMDGKVFSCIIGENTTAQDLVRRLCRSRRSVNGPRPIISDAADWALFEVQRHVDKSALREPQSAVDGASPPKPERPSVRVFRQLAQAEPLLDQLLVRWEMTARFEYGAATSAPPGHFELVMRKVRGGARQGGVHAEEAELEMAQLRSDLLDGRLSAVLGDQESLDLASVHVLREMHVRGPRTAAFSKSTVALSLSVARNKNRAMPTLEFDLLASELPSVLPPQLRADSDANALERLKDRYKTLFKRPIDSWSQQLETISDTARLVQNARQEVIGVAFDGKGQVVVDRKSAERVLRDRMADEPLCFGATYPVGVWSSRTSPVQQMLVAVNHLGVHLHTSEMVPHRVGSFSYEWQASTDSKVSTIIGWQTVQHHFASEAEQDLATKELHGPYGTSSLVLHLLVPPSASDMLTLKLLRANQSHGSMSDRPQAQLHRRRAKLVMLTRDGEEIKAWLAYYSQEFAHREKTYPGGARAFFSTLAAGRPWTHRSSMLVPGGPGGLSRHTVATAAKVTGAFTARRAPTKHPLPEVAGNASKITSDETSFPTERPLASDRSGESPFSAR